MSAVVLTKVSQTISFPGIGLEINPSRVAFSIGNWNFYWYGAIIAVGFLLAVYYCYKGSRRFGITQDELVDELIFAVPIGIVCARLYYVIFTFSDYRDNLVDIVKIWTGGLAIYGGIIGGFLTIIVFCLVRKIKPGAMLDLCSLGILIGQAVGRWGNLINREAHGVTTSLPWRMGITDAVGKTYYYHPTFLYEFLWNLLGFALLHFYSKRRRKFDGQIFLMYIGWYGLGRAIIEGLRTDSLYIFGSIRVSQMVGILSVVVSLFLLFYQLVFKTHEPEELFVNARAAAAVPGGTEEDAGDEAEEERAQPSAAEPDGEAAASEEDDGDIPDEPVVEPIDVVLHDEDSDKDGGDGNGGDH